VSDDELPESLDEVLAYQAREVQQLLKHPALLKAFAATRDRIVRQWEAVPMDDPLGREQCRHKLEVFKELQRELRAFGDRRPALIS
jgi:hypothetical protein